MDVQFISQKKQLNLKILVYVSIALFGFVVASFSFVSIITFFIFLIVYMIFLSVAYLYMRNAYGICHIDQLDDDILIDHQTYSFKYIDEVRLTKRFYVIERENMMIYLPRTKQIDELIKKKEWKVELSQMGWQYDIFIIALIILMINMFYQIFVMFWGMNLYLFMDFQVINRDIIGMRILQIVLIIILLFIAKKVKNRKVFWILPCLMIVVLAYMNTMTYVPSEKIQNNGNIAYVYDENNLYLYQDVQKEYGFLKETLYDVDDYEKKNFTNLLTLIKYYQYDEWKYYIFYRHDNTLQQRKEKFDQYKNLIFQNEMYTIEFDDELLKLNDGLEKGQLVIHRDEMTLMNDCFLEIKDDHQVKYYLYLPTNEFQKDRICILNVDTMQDEDLYYKRIINQTDDQSSSISQGTDTSYPKSSNELKQKEVTQDEKDSNGKNIVQKLNEAAKDIDHFQSNKEIVKMKATTQDYNLILKEIAKTFTINNNNDLKIDTQILRIDITSGNIQEFGAHVFDRQDIEGQEKRLNNYYYRVKKVDNYYIAVRVEEDTNVDIGLKKLDEPISTDTSYTTDYLYCIEGKKEVEGW